MRCLAFLLALGICSAQEFRATLTGRVLDPASVPIAGARVQLQNIDTNESLFSDTDHRGNYTFALIKPGNYALRAEHAGFKVAIRNGVTLSVNQAANLDLKLELGTVNQEVTVTAEAPLLDSASADRGGVIDEQTIKEMPLNGRNPFMLSMLVAGVNYNGSLAYFRPFDNGAIASWGISGGASGSNEFLLDGVPNNAQAGTNNIAYVPPVDSVQEFKIQTNSYDAQYGKTSGGIVNVVLKSGTNKTHGSIYEFARRNAWDANSFQNNARGAPREGHYLDQYGVQVDGPVIIPQLYNGRNRTFFLANYEGYREATPQPLVLAVPALEMRDGDFSKLADAQGRKITIFDPNTTFFNDANNKWDRTPFAGNIVPKARINPISRKIVGYFPNPNTSTSSTEYAQSNYFISGGQSLAKDNFYNIVVKVDQNLGSRNRFFFRHASNDRTEIRTTNGLFTSPAADGQLPLKRVNDAYVVDWITTISPTLLLNVRSSFSRYVEGSRSDAAAGFDIATLGFPAKLAGQLPGGPFFGRYTFDNYISLGRYPGNNITNTFTLHPNLTKILGAHTIKTGYDMRWGQYSTQNYGNVFTLGATKGFTQQDYTRGDNLSGNSIASWLLGTPSSGSLNYTVFPIFLFPYSAPWIQHDWKVSPRLTINSGLRLDFNVPPNERFNRMNRGFDAQLTSPVDAMIDHSKFPGLPVIKGAMLFAGVNGQSRNAADAYYNTWQPRVGFAYSLTPRTVLRGGWGRYYINPNNDYLQTNGYSLTTPLVFSGDEGRTSANNKINDPFPNGIILPYGNDFGPLTYMGRGFNFVNPKFRIPHMNSFSVGVQRALTNRAKFEVTYAGSRGADLQSSKAFNDDDTSIRDKCNYMTGGNPNYCSAGLPNPFLGLTPFQDTSYYTNKTISRGNLFRPYPEFGGLTELMRNDGVSWYNSLQTIFSIRNRWTNLTSNYTFSKTIDQNGFLDPIKNIIQRSLSAYDHTHRFVLSGVTQLPLGRNSHGVAAKLLKGWENSIIVSTQTGRPWDLPGNVLYLKDARLPIDWNVSRVQAIKPCVNRWNENNTITLQPFSKDYGCTDVNFLIVPSNNPRYTPYRDGRLRLQGSRLVDFSLNKMTSLNERYRVQFRAEVFNALNSFFLVGQSFNNNADSASFGSIVKAAVSAPSSNYPRQIQLAVKFLW